MQTYTLEITQNSNLYRFILKNTGSTAIKLDKITVLSGKMPFHSDTPVYGEGYSMLSQYTGTISQLSCLTKYADSGHYHFPQKTGMQTVYNMALFGGKNVTLWGFVSSRRFSGEICWNNEQYEIVQRLYGITLLPGTELALEDFCILEGERNDVLTRFAALISDNHPLRPTKERPCGWCSWYCFGPNVTAKNITDNMDVIKNSLPALRFIQIDDGYQDKMGDWLISNKDFGNAQVLCRQIKSRGLEPAIWLAPFIAEKQSKLFREHPDFFIKDENGTPLASNLVTFGGWRCGPWYMLDGTNPNACTYIADIFRTMKEEWGVNYFKLDANVWGAMPFGCRYDNQKTPVEGYRLMMKAICKAVGDDGFILGCNAPMWPSIGVVNAMRVSNDVARRWSYISSLAKENFFRNWQNGRLWLNDPDCIVQISKEAIVIDGAGQLSKDEALTKDEFAFQAAYLFASGGMLMVGDDMVRYTDKEISLLQRFLHIAPPSARFKDNTFAYGISEKNGYTYHCLFNFGDEPMQSIEIDDGYDVINNCNCNGKIILSPHCGKIIQTKSMH